MKYSFVISTHDRKEILKNTLEAINCVDYDHNNFEVIIIDDASQDNTYEHIKSINRKYKLNYLHFEKKKKDYCASVKNHGWQNAEGEIIVIIDSDIIVNKDYLKQLDRCFLFSDNILVTGTRIFLSKEIPYSNVFNGKIYNQFKSPLNIDVLENRYFVFDKFSYNAMAYRYPWLKVYGFSMAVSKRLLEKFNGFDENFINWSIEDVELSYRLFNEGIKIIFNSKMDVLHQHHGNDRDLIISSRYRDIEENCRYFIAKHPKAIDLSEKEIFDLFKGILDYSLVEQQETTYEIIVIDFIEKEKLSDVKKRILESSNEVGKYIIVNDFVEDSDIDIWIQLMDKCKSVPRYFPISKKLTPY